MLYPNLIVILQLFGKGILHWAVQKVISHISDISGVGLRLQRLRSCRRCLQHGWRRPSGTSQIGPRAKVVGRTVSQKEPTLPDWTRRSEFVCLFGFRCTFPCKCFLSHTARYTSLIGAILEPIFWHLIVTGGFKKIYISLCTLSFRKGSRKWAKINEQVVELLLPWREPAHPAHTLTPHPEKDKHGSSVLDKV